jgi:hypothetical protein
MPWYNDLRPAKDTGRKDYALIFPELTAEEKIRTISGLQRLRDGLKKEVNKKQTDHNLLIASWNIKEFGHTTQRLPEAYFYIAEIINSFDLVSIQEIKSSLHDLQIIMRILGSDWKYVVNDITEGSAGNDERSAYLYNRKSVELSGVVGELVLWDEIVKDAKYIKQLKRTPYLTGFRAGWKEFSFINLHLHPGKGKYDFNDENEHLDVDVRQEEVKLLLTAMKSKVENKRLWNEKFVLVGDFNLYENDDTDKATIQMFEDRGYKEPEGLKGKDTNVSGSEVYDRMFFYGGKYFRIAKDDVDREVGEVFDPFQYVYRDVQAEIIAYKAYMKEVYTGSKNLDKMDNLKNYFHHYWKRNQLSDHLPIWTELIIDDSDKFLASKKKEIEKELD